MDNWRDNAYVGYKINCVETGGENMIQGYIKKDEEIHEIKETLMGECCGNGCNGCSVIEESKSISGYINIYDVGGMYQAMSAFYSEEEKAIEVGNSTKGYIGTVFVSLDKKGGGIDAKIEA